MDRFTVRKDLLETILVTPNIGRICQGFRRYSLDFSPQSSLIIAKQRKSEEVVQVAQMNMISKDSEPIRT